MLWKLTSFVVAGGAAGCLARYAVSGWATRGDSPYGTLIVNVAGCFVVGLLYFGGLAGGWLPPKSGGSHWFMPIQAHVRVDA